MIIDPSALETNTEPINLENTPFDFTTWDRSIDGNWSIDPTPHIWICGRCNKITIKNAISTDEQFCSHKGFTVYLNPGMKLRG